MSDPIEELIEKLRHNRDIDERVLTPNALHEVGEVFERYGFGATRLYLLDKQNRRDSRAQASAADYLHRHARYPEPGAQH